LPHFCQFLSTLSRFYQFRWFSQSLGPLNLSRRFSESQFLFLFFPFESTFYSLPISSILSLSSFSLGSLNFSLVPLFLPFLLSPLNFSLKFFRLSYAYIHFISSRYPNSLFLIQRLTILPHYSSKSYLDMPPKSLGKSKPISSSSHRKTNSDSESASTGKSKPPPLTRTTRALQYFVVDTVLPSHVVNDRSLFTTYAPSKRVHRTAFGTEITIEGTGNVEVRVLAGGKTILFTIHDCWHVPSSPHHFLSSLTVTTPSRGHHIMLAGRTPRLLFSQQRRLAKPNLPKYVPFAREGGYFVLKFDVPAQVSNLKCNPITQTPPSFSLQASLHHPFAGLSFHKTSMADYLSNSTHSEAALVSSKLSVPYENVSGCLGASVSHPIPPPSDPLPNIDRLPSPRLHRDAAAPRTRTIAGQVFDDSIRFHDQRKAARERTSHHLPLPEVVANGGAVSVVAGDLLHASGCAAVVVADRGAAHDASVTDVVVVADGDVAAHDVTDVVVDGPNHHDGVAVVVDYGGEIVDCAVVHSASASVPVDVEADVLRTHSADVALHADAEDQAANLNTCEGDFNNRVRNVLRSFNPSLDFFNFADGFISCTSMSESLFSTHHYFPSPSLTSIPSLPTSTPIFPICQPTLDLSPSSDSRTQSNHCRHCTVTTNWVPVHRKCCSSCLCAWGC
jgi:hypothetical protein